MRYQAVMPMETGLIQQIVDDVSRWWGYAVGFMTAIGTMLVFVRKHILAICRAFIAWWQAAIMLPQTIALIQKELQTPNGMPLSQMVHSLGDDLRGLRHLLAAETAARRAGLQLVPVPIFECDRYGHFLWANNAMLDLADMEINHLLGGNWRNIVAGPDREQVMMGWQRAIEDGTDYTVKFRLSRDGDEVWVRFQAFCQKDELGNVLGFNGQVKETADPRVHSTQAGQ